MVLRLLRYPKQPDPVPEDLFGSAPHSDYGALTILAQDGVGGLEVKTPDGRWIEAAPEAGCLVLNTGDMMRRWSNNLLLSTPHRVVNRSGRTRYSIPFFLSPDMDATIEPLSQFVNQHNPPHYSPVNFGEYLNTKLRNNYNY